MTDSSVQIGLVAYLRNLTVEGGRIARACSDARAKAEIEDLCAEIAGKCEAIETLFEIPETLK